MSVKYIDPTASWPNPAPLPSVLRSVPDMDHQLLPASIRNWVADIADRQGCAPEFPAVTALVHMGAILGRKIGVRPKRKGANWTVVPNLFGAIVSPPSMLKSPGIREARLPFKKVEKRLLEDAEAEQVLLREDFTSTEFEYEAEVAAIKEGWKQLKSGKATRGGRLPDRAGLNERSADLSSMKDDLDDLKRRAFAERRIEVNDPTPEALQVVLSNNPNGILYFNDELTSWLESLNRPGREGSRQMHLEMWEGTDDGTVDRIKRGHIEYNKIESIFGSIQPGPLGEMVDKALSPNKSNDGLIQRFQLLVWRNKFKGTPKDKEPDLAAVQKAEGAFMRLYEITPEAAGCADAEIPYLLLSPEAYALWWTWYVDLQGTASRYSEELTSHMMKYPSLVISLALIDHIADGGTGDVGVESMQRAFGLMKWLWAHAERIYSASGHSDRSRLRKLASRIKNRRLGGDFTLRDLKQHNWSVIVKDDARVLLDDLVMLNWLKHDVVSNPQGGPKSDVYTVNPKVFKISDLPNQASQPSQLTHVGSYEGYECGIRQNENNESIDNTNNTSGIKDEGAF